MRKNFKLITSVVASAALMIGCVMPAMADEGSASGDARYEGYVEEVSVFSVEVPTTAANIFDFTVDPNGLLKDTDYARLLSETVSAANFDSSAKLYFANTKTESEVTTDPWYTNTSKSITCTNKSSYDVNVEVTATVTGAEGITLGDVADATDPTLYLAIKTDDTDSDKQTIAITSDGGTYSSEIAGEDTNFIVRYNATAEKYEYVERTNTATDKNYNKNGDEVSTGGSAGTPLADWKTVSFYLTGDCGGEWTDDQASATIGVDLVWKVTDPNAAPQNAAPSISVLTYSVPATGDLEITTNLGSGDDKATGVASVLGNSGSALASDGSRWTFNSETKKVAINGDWLRNAFSGKPDDHSINITVVFDDDADTSVQLTITK